MEENSEIVCSSCGFRSFAAAKFCGGCGSLLARGTVCRACGAAAEPEDRFCAQCGNRLSGAAPAASVSAGRKSLLGAWWSRLGFRAKSILTLAALGALCILAVVALRGGVGGSDGQQSEFQLPSLTTSPRAHIEPSPSDIDISSDPTVHHALEMVSNGSATVIAGPGSERLAVHNSTDLAEQERDACAEVQPWPEGDSRVLLIKPEDIRGEWRARFYLVGCTPGEGTVIIEGGGEILSEYTVTVK